MSESLSRYCLGHSVKDVLIGEGAIGQFLHLLQLGLGVVEGQAAERGKETGYHACAEWMIGYIIRTFRVYWVVPR